MKYKILIFGASGMLGHRLFIDLPNLNKNSKVIGIIRTKKDKGLFNNNSNQIKIFNNFKNMSEIGKLLKSIKPNVIINALGIIKQKKKTPYYDYLYFNSIFPRVLEHITKNSCKIINISTDCVFDGVKGNYTELSNDLSNDVYGISKYLGEIQAHNNLTLRTSIIGHEIKNHKSLLEWFINNKDEVIHGYKNVFFSGLTTNEMSKVLNIILTKNYNLKGIYHLSSRKISKLNLLKKINQIYKLRKNIKPKKVKHLDRSLNSHKIKKISKIKIKTWKEMIIDMYNEHLVNK
tara:strand:+ start:630 stop:1499 length:870 start_codon:yes stop_codon:yes gene_type:complete